MDGNRWESYHRWTGLLTAKPRAIERIQVGTKYALKLYRQTLLESHRTTTVTCNRPFKLPVGSWVLRVCVVVHFTKGSAVHLFFWGTTALPIPPILNRTTLGTYTFYFLSPIKVNFNHFIICYVRNNNKKGNSIFIK